MIYNILLFVSSFFMVFLVAIQNQNVVHGHKMYAFITSYLIATAQVATTLLVVSSGWYSIPLVGSGGACGVVSGILFFRKYLKRTKI